MSLSLPPVILVDTSVLCELLEVPTRASSPAVHQQQLVRFSEEGATLLLPMATLIETGNHIAQNGHEAQRRKVATDFVALVEGALSGQGKPFATASFPNEVTVKRWLAIFPAEASRNAQRRKGIGLGDVSILDEFDRQCRLNPRRPVRIWSLDHPLRRERHPA